MQGWVQSPSGVGTKLFMSGEHLVNSRHHDYHWLGQMQLNLVTGQFNSGALNMMEFRANQVG